MRHVLVCSLAFAGSLAIAADGDLDPSFGSGGKVRIPYTDVQAADIGEQSDGTLLLVGWRTDVNNAVIVPFTAGGSATGYVAIGCAGTCQLVSVAVLPDNRFVVAGTNGSSGMVRRETANY